MNIPFVKPVLNRPTMSWIVAISSTICRIDIRSNATTRGALPSSPAMTWRTSASLTRRRFFTRTAKAALTLELDATGTKTTDAVATLIKRTNSA
jgi:hypothetical protein